MHVVVVAEESAGAQALRLVVERGHRVVGALTSAEGPVAGVAADHGLPVLEPDLVRDPAFADWISERDVDLLVNVHSLRIADGAVVTAPRIGAYNLHPGPLPRYAGLNAPSWAIYEGETRHAVTLHRMSATVDAGPIAYEAWFDIGSADTGLQVATNCVRHGVPLVGRLLDDAARGADHVPATPQAAEGRRWFGRRPPHDGRLPWHLPARRIVDLVRASSYAPFPSPWGWPRTTLERGGDEGDDGGAGVGGAREVEIVRVAATGEPAGAAPGTIGGGWPDGPGVPVASGDEWVLVERLRLGGTATAPRDVLTEGGRFAPPSDSAPSAR
jgi:UDP-4-amino-4-deoxy-L-arabinose formyltransferase/UDP-glucuronic acid dehydrogenase (UDP-4-keto-hexauronic acid decarboxylating)